MGKYQPSDIVNVCLVGHADSGKTTLADNILHKAGAVGRAGSVKEETSLFDFDELEREKGHSIDSAIARFEYGGRVVNLVDTPGYPDFLGEALCPMCGVDGVVVCINANNGVQVNTRRVWDAAVKLEKARMIVVTKSDLQDTNLDDLMASIVEWFGDRCLPFNLPQGFGAAFAGIDDVVGSKGEVNAEAASFYESVVEASVESDDDVMNQYLEGEEIGDELMQVTMRKAIHQGLVVPIFFTSCENGIGDKELLEAIVKYMPSCAETTPRKLYENTSGEGEGEEVDPDPGSTLNAHVFKVQMDRHVGKVSYLRIASGTMKPGETFLNSSGGRKEKIGHIMLPFGKDMTNADEAGPGEIVALTKVDSLHLGDTISSTDAGRSFAPLPIPQPMAQLAIRPANRADETKIGEALTKIADEISTFIVERQSSTNELIASGLSALQLDVCFKRMKDRYGIEVATSQARVPYKECITTNSKGHYRHKKQTGGRGQFGEVYLDVAPSGPEEKGLSYNWKVVGGSIPSNFAPAIEKGIKEKMLQGVIAGYSIEDIVVNVTDGKFHDVDSSEAAFKIAGGRAFAEAVKNAQPVLLEPMAEAEIVVPASNMGDISGDLNTRRGRIQGMEAKGPFQVISATVPKAEMAEYPRVLTSLTSGEGSFSYQEREYEQVPANVQQQIVAQFNPTEEED